MHIYAAMDLRPQSLEALVNRMCLTHKSAGVNYGWSLVVANGCIMFVREHGLSGWSNLMCMHSDIHLPMYDCTMEHQVSHKERDIYRSYDNHCECQSCKRGDNGPRRSEGPFIRLEFLRQPYIGLIVRRSRLEKNDLPAACIHRQPDTDLGCWQCSVS